MAQATHKTIIAGVLWLSGLFPTAAQTPVWVAHWPTQGLSASGALGGLKLAIADNGEILCAGAQGSGVFAMDGLQATILGSSDMVIAKLDPQGQPLWLGNGGGIECYEYGGDGAGWIAMTEPSDGAYTMGWFQSGSAYFGDTVLHGYCDNFGGGLNLFIARSSTANGEFHWARSVQGDIAEPGALLLSPDETAWVFGRSSEGSWGAIVQDLNPSIQLPPGAFLVKYDPQGQVLGADRIMPHGGVNDAEWSGQDIVVGGWYSGQDSLWGTALPEGGVESNGFVGVVGQNGEPIWVNSLMGDSMVMVTELAQLSDGSVIAVGIYSHRLVVGADTLIAEGPGYASGAFITSFSSTGDLNWIRRIDEESEPGEQGWMDNEDGVEGVYDLQVGPDDAIYLQGLFSGHMSIGSTEFASTASRDMYVAKLNALGECVAVLCFGRSERHVGGGSVVPTDDAVFISGTFDSTMVVGGAIVEPGEIGTSDFFVAKFDSLSGFTGIRVLAPQEELLHLYPDPNNGICTIDIPSRVRFKDDLFLSIFDVTGHGVRLVPITMGSASVQLDIQTQAKGIYHLELVDGQQRYTGRMVFE